MDNHSSIEEDPEHGVEKSPAAGVALRSLEESRRRAQMREGSASFIGRVGGNQEFVDVNHSPLDELGYDTEPDAIPGMTLKQQLSIRSFSHIRLWKAALIEGVGQFNRSERRG